jgi:transketolase
MAVQTYGDKATREVFGPTLAKLCEDGLDIVCVDADLGYSTSAVKFGAKFPERFFPVGVAEQNMIGVAAGLATCGKVAFCSSFAVFAPGHCFDQLRMAVAQPRTNVKLFASHAGVVTGEDGASAEALEDLALMLSMPPFTVLFPADAVECEQAIEVAARTDGPFYIRALRPKTPIIFDDKYKFQPGKWPRLRDGNDVTLIACGELVHAALEAAEKLAADGIEARVFNASSLRPMDTDALLKAAQETGAIVTAEDHFVTGGLGSIVAQELSEKQPTPVEFVGMRDRYGTSGTWKQLLEYFHLTPDAIAQAARNVIARKSG